MSFKATVTAARPLATVLERRRHIFLSRDATVLEAVRLMGDFHVGAVGVVEKGKLLGILTERDVTMRVIAVGRDPAETKLRQVMTPSPVTLHIDSDTNEALDIMCFDGFRHVPILDSMGHPLGIVDIRDLFDEVRVALEKSVHAQGTLLTYMFDDSYGGSGRNTRTDF